MVYAFLVAAIVLFAVCIKLFGVLPKVRVAVAATRQATAVMASRELSEAQKEAAIRIAAIEMFGHAGSILGRVALILAVPLAFVILGSALGLYLLQDVVRAASDWYFILGSTIVMVGLLLVVK